MIIYNQKWMLLQWWGRSNPPSFLKKLNLIHSQVVGTQNILALGLAPITSHLVKLSLPNIIIKRLRFIVFDVIWYFSEW